MNKHHDLAQSWLMRLLHTEIHAAETENLFSEPDKIKFAALFPVFFQYEKNSNKEKIGKRYGFSLTSLPG